MDERIRTALAAQGATLTSVKPLHGGACQENFKVELTVDGHHADEPVRRERHREPLREGWRRRRARARRWLPLPSAA
jgi:hypothetical protein